MNSIKTKTTTTTASATLKKVLSYQLLVTSYLSPVTSYWSLLDKLNNQKHSKHFEIETKDKCKFLVILFVIKLYA